MRGMNRGLCLSGILVLAACSAPDPAAIPGLSADDVRRALGVGCVETQPGIDAGWSLECTNGGQSATAVGQGSGDIDIVSADGELSALDTLTWLEALATLTYQGADPGVAVPWVHSHFRDPTCESTDTHRTECSIVIGEARLTLEWDQRGLLVGGPISVGLSIIAKDSPYNHFSQAPSASQGASAIGIPLTRAGVACTLPIAAGRCLANFGYWHSSHQLVDSPHEREWGRQSPSARRHP